jgi:predicted peptidase
MKPITAAIAIASCLLGLESRARAAAVSDFQARSYKVSAAKSIPYRLFVPKNYSAGKKYPVMLALHGGGERGNNNTSQLLHVFTNFWADDSIQKDNPCFVVAPQCPLNEVWVASATFGNYDFTKTPITDNLQAAMNILDSLEKEFSIDRDREYVSGMSLGGAGTWYSITKFPDRFAAAVPVCGGGDPNQAKVLDRVPIWTFHEVDDPTVPVHYTQDLVKAIRAVGGKNLTYTEYPASMGFGHESWKPAAKDPALHRWVFQQVRATTSAITLRQAKGARLAASSNASATPVLRIDGLGRIRMDRVGADRSLVRYFDFVSQGPALNGNGASGRGE